MRGRYRCAAKLPLSLWIRRVRARHIVFLWAYALRYIVGAERVRSDPQSMHHLKIHE